MRFVGTGWTTWLVVAATLPLRPARPNPRLAPLGNRRARIHNGYPALAAHFVRGSDLQVADNNA